MVTGILVASDPVFPADQAGFRPIGLDEWLSGFNLASFTGVPRDRRAWDSGVHERVRTVALRGVRSEHQCQLKFSGHLAVDVITARGLILQPTSIAHKQSMEAIAQSLLHGYVLLVGIWASTCVVVQRSDYSMVEQMSF